MGSSPAIPTMVMKKGDLWSMPSEAQREVIDRLIARAKPVYVDPPRVRTTIEDDAPADGVRPSAS